MRLRTILTTIIALASLHCASASADAEKSKISIHVHGLNNENGVVRIALFDKEEAFSAKDYSVDGAVMKAIAPIKSDSAEYTFQDVPPGTYAVRLFHDEDNSGKFKTGAFGIPSVQYGFSNNAHGFMGPPSFAKAKFDVKGTSVELIIEVSKK